jgi:hypothetical protein
LLHALVSVNVRASGSKLTLSASAAVVLVEGTWTNPDQSLLVQDTWSNTSTGSTSPIEEEAEEMDRLFGVGTEWRKRQLGTVAEVEEYDLM